MTSKKEEWILDVEYPADLYFGDCPDQKIKDLVGRGTSSSGMGFGCRDMQFSFDTKDEAKTARMILEGALGKEFSLDVIRWEEP